MPSLEAPRHVTIKRPVKLRLDLSSRQKKCGLQSRVLGRDTAMNENQKPARMPDVSDPVVRRWVAGRPPF